MNICKKLVLFICLIQMCLYCNAYAQNKPEISDIYIEENILNIILSQPIAQSDNFISFIYNGEEESPVCNFDGNTVSVEIPQICLNDSDITCIRIDANAQFLKKAYYYGMQKLSHRVMYENDYEPDENGNYEKFLWTSGASHDASYGIIGTGGYWADNNKTGQLIRNHKLILSSAFYIQQTSPLFLKENVDEPTGTSKMTTSNKYYSEENTNVSVDISAAGNLNGLIGGVATRVYLREKYSESASFKINRKGSAYMAYLTYAEDENTHLFKLCRYDNDGTSIETVLMQQDIPNVTINDMYNISISAKTQKSGAVNLRGVLINSNTGEKVTLEAVQDAKTAISGGTFGIVGNYLNPNLDVSIQYDNLLVEESGRALSDDIVYENNGFVIYNISELMLTPDFDVSDAPIDSLSIKVSEAVDKDSLQGAVSIKDSDGNILPNELLLKTDGSTITAEIKGGLCCDEEYTIELSDKITDVFGQHLNEDFVQKFKTKKYRGIYIDGFSIENKINDASAKEIKADYRIVNPTDRDETGFVMILLYGDDNSVIGVKSEDIGTILAHETTETKHVIFTDAENVKKVTLYFWNNSKDFTAWHMPAEYIN